MPRLDPIEKEAAPEAAREFYERDEERYGLVLNNTKLYAHSTPVLRAVKQFVGSFNEAQSIPLAHKALLRVRVATLNGCPF